jgi:crotonobetainyl-CoA:carnitine CoA-transferase CaiB-like acyl-CoA transferase
LVTSSLFETTAFLVGQHMAQQGVTGEEPPPMSVRRSAWAIYDIFQCKDDGQVFVGVVSDSLWQAFCEEFGLDELGRDSSLASNNDRVKHKERILAVVTPLFEAMDKNELVQRLERAGIPFAPINRPSDLFDDPHLTANGGLVEVTLRGGENEGRKVKLPALPLEMNGHKFAVRHDLAAEGEDTASVLAEIGYSTEQIAELVAQGQIKAA